ncbi:hypothetical protein DFQ28_010697, partial [Apophysomyces sp. BC1034]
MTTETPESPVSTRLHEHSAHPKLKDKLQQLDSSPIPGNNSPENDLSTYERSARPPNIADGESRLSLQAVISSLNASRETHSTTSASPSRSTSGKSTSSASSNTTGTGPSISTGLPPQTGPRFPWPHTPEISLTPPTDTADVDPIAVSLDQPPPPSRTAPSASIAVHVPGLETKDSSLSSIHALRNAIATIRSDNVSPKARYNEMYADPSFLTMNGPEVTTVLARDQQQRSPTAMLCTAPIIHRQSPPLPSSPPPLAHIPRANTTGEELPTPANDPTDASPRERQWPPTQPTSTTE